MSIASLLDSVLHSGSVELQPLMPALTGAKRWFRLPTPSKIDRTDDIDIEFELDAAVRELLSVYAARLGDLS